VESTVDEGTTFRFRLPVEEVAEQRA